MEYVDRIKAREEAAKKKARKVARKPRKVTVKPVVEEKASKSE